MIAAGMAAYSDEKKSTAPENTCDNIITITGVVVEIIDMTPVDGGVILKIVDEDSDTYEFELWSPMMTPWTKKEELLYRKLSGLETGSRVTATGCALEHSIALLDFRILG